MFYCLYVLLVVAMFIPVIKEWCREKEVAPSLFLIPLSFATIAGGICTLIGTSTNLVANGLMIDENLQVCVNLHLLTFQSFGFFELGYVGIPCAALTCIFLCTLGPNLLPKDKGGLLRMVPTLQFTNASE
jgi:di/tricarboxylate transporter